MSRELPAEVSVELDAAELGGPARVGTLRRVPSPSGAIVAFVYDETWLTRPGAFVLDPAHGPYPGDQNPRAGDSCQREWAEKAPADASCQQELFVKGRKPQPMDRL